MEQHKRNLIKSLLNASQHSAIVWQPSSFKGGATASFNQLKVELIPPRQYSAEKEPELDLEGWRLIVYDAMLTPVMEINDDPFSKTGAEERKMFRDLYNIVYGSLIKKEVEAVNQILSAINKNLNK